MHMHVGFSQWYGHHSASYTARRGTQAQKDDERGVYEFSASDVAGLSPGEIKAVIEKVPPHTCPH